MAGCERQKETGRELKKEVRNLLLERRGGKKKGLRVNELQKRG